MGNRNYHKNLIYIGFFSLVWLFVGMAFSAKADPTKAEDLISIDYKDAKLTSVLKALAYSNDLNLVVTKDIKGTVSAKLKDITVEEALHAILSVNGYTFVREGKLIYVVEGSGLDDFGMETTTIHLSYLTAAEAKQLLTKVISSRGDIQINSATNSLVVTDYAQRIEKVQKVLKDIDIPPIQVLIEAKILDIQAKAFQNLGITTSITYDPRGSNSGGGVWGRSTNAAESVSGATDLGGPSSILSGDQMTITTVLKDLNVSVTLDALIQQNKAHLLASPSIATLNGKEARIIIGDKVPIIEKTITDTVTTEATTFIDVGTTLRVTPQVSPDGWITMNVHPEVSSVTANLDAGPNITTREADAMIRVKDGQTIIIGGLISKQDDRIQGGVPVLKSIPILGGLFSNKSTDLQEKELTVFITPHIIESPKEFSARNASKDVILDVQRVGKQNLVQELMAHARNLGDENSVESANKSFLARKEAMLRTYQMIANQFPDANEADYALMRVGQLSLEKVHYQDAINAFDRLIENYPYSVLREKAKEYLSVAKQKQKDREALIRQELMTREKVY